MRKLIFNKLNEYNPECQFFILKIFSKRLFLLLGAVLIFSISFLGNYLSENDIGLCNLFTWHRHYVTIKWRFGKKNFK